MLTAEKVNSQESVTKARFERREFSELGWAPKD